MKNCKTHHPTLQKVKEYKLTCTLTYVQLIHLNIILKLRTVTLA